MKAHYIRVIFIDGAWFLVFKYFSQSSSGICSVTRVKNDNWRTYENLSMQQCVKLGSHMKKYHIKLFNCSIEQILQYKPITAHFYRSVLEYVQSNDVIINSNKAEQYNIYEQTEHKSFKYQFSCIFMLMDHWE